MPRPNFFIEATRLTNLGIHVGYRDKLAVALSHMYDRGKSDKAAELREVLGVRDQG